MKEEIRVLMPTEIPRIREEVEIDSIREELNHYVQTLITHINLQDLDDWRLLINVMAQSADAIGVAKRIARYPSDKEFAIYIGIPIPDNDQIAYGLPSVKEAFFKADNEKYSYILEPEFENYSNLYQYILESAKRAIDLAFNKGFTCNGKKIKFE